jgi:hypothetical protein
MTAVTALEQVLAAGIRVTRDGDHLVLMASNPPPVWVVEPLKRHKAEILTMLSLGTGCSKATRPLLCGSGCSMEARDQQQSQPIIVARPREDDPLQTELCQPPSTEFGPAPFTADRARGIVAGRAKGCLAQGLSFPV